jgi:hypothetical protein
MRRRSARAGRQQKGDVSIGHQKQCYQLGTVRLNAAALGLSTFV